MKRLRLLTWMSFIHITIVVNGHCVCIHFLIHRHVLLHVDSILIIEFTRELIVVDNPHIARGIRGDVPLALRR